MSIKRELEGLSELYYGVQLVKKIRFFINMIGFCYFASLIFQIINAFDHHSLSIVFNKTFNIHAMKNPATNWWILLIYTPYSILQIVVGAFIWRERKVNVIKEECVSYSSIGTSGSGTFRYSKVSQNGEQAADHGRLTFIAGVITVITLTLYILSIIGPLDVKL